MAFLFSRNNKKKKTWYVGYYVEGKYVRKRIGRSKVLAEKARGEIESKVERKETGLLQRDYSFKKFFRNTLKEQK